MTRRLCIGLLTASLALAIVVGGATTQAHEPAAAGGTLVGHVKLSTPAPPNRPISMGADLKCLEINNGKRVDQDTVLRDPDGGLRNAFVSLQGTFPPSTPPAQPIFIEQQGCVYHPRVQGAQVGQTLIVKNDDDTLHNIHSLSTKGNLFNTGQPKAGLEFKYVLKAEEVMLHVKCDVHPWMTGYLGVVSHPYFAVTGPQGAFTITNIPPGHYTVQAWHERFGTTTQAIDIKAGSATVVEFSYSASGQASGSPAGFAARELRIPHEPVAGAPAIVQSW
jgi:Carboxypeptidase regulatory-like domain